MELLVVVSDTIVSVDYARRLTNKERPASESVTAGTQSPRRYDTFHSAYWSQQDLVAPHTTGSPVCFDSVVVRRASSAAHCAGVSRRGLAYKARVPGQLYRKYSNMQG